MEGRELPVGWVEVPIGDLCDLRNGRAFKPVEWTDSGIPIVRIQNLNNPSAKFNYYQGELDAKHWLRGGELLFAWSGTPGTSFGAHVWEGGDAALNQHIFRVDFDENSIDKAFFRFAINQQLNDLIDIAHGGVGLRHVTKGKFEATEISLPPLNEQRRIAAKLDTTLAAVEACRQRLDGVAAILKRFRQAVLAAATSGELTREWREERGLANSWKAKVLSEIADSRLGKMLDQSKNTGRLTPYLRNINVRWFSFDLDDIQEMRLEDAEIIDLDVRFGDLLVCEGGEPGRCAVWRGEDSKYTFQKALHRVRTSKHLLADYLSFCLSNSANNGKLEQLFTGTTIKHLTGASLKKFQIPLPSREEQEEIVDRVKSLFSLADQLEARLTAARKIVDRLTPALLAKAFRGELVPQDPADEPASVLLAKLKSTQADALHVSPRRRAKQLTRREAMSILDKDSVKAAILTLKSDRFSFDELRHQAGGDYETLKGILFQLLEEPSPVVRQVFDQEAKAMKLERIRP